MTPARRNASKPARAAAANAAARVDALERGEDGTQSLGDVVTARLREQIVSDELHPGTRMVEREIAKQLGVSRSPVREALHRLEEEGLVRTLDSGGAYVSMFTVDEVREIYEVRAALERCVGQLVAPIVKPPDLRSLREIVERMRAAAEAGDAQGQIQADVDFHGLLAALSGNRRLQSTLASLHSQILRVVFLSISQTPTARRIEDHEFLIVALSRRDPEIAGLAMARHVLDAGEQAVSALLAQFADGDGLQLHPSRVPKRR